MTEDGSVHGSCALVLSSQSQMHLALSSWLDDEFGRTASSAPQAVELLGKAVLWSVNPTLLVPLDPKNEQVLIDLATEPRLDSSTLRTISLRVTLSRLIKLVGDLPVPENRRKRLIACRDGSLHVGTLPATGDDSAEVVARKVLADCLTLCRLLLERLDMSPADFYAEHAELVDGLLEEHRSEVQHRVARKMAQATERLERFRVHFSNDELSDENAEQLSLGARYAYDPKSFGEGLGSVSEGCPNCYSSGVLIGRVDVDSDVDVDVADRVTVLNGCWNLHLYPQHFACNVCKLVLHGVDELRVAGLYTDKRQVSEFDLGGDFSAAEWAEEQYGSM